MKFLVWLLLLAFLFRVFDFEVIVPPESRPLFLLYPEPSPSLMRDFHVHSSCEGTKVAGRVFFSKLTVLDDSHPDDGVQSIN